MLSDGFSFLIPAPYMMIHLSLIPAHSEALRCMMRKRILLLIIQFQSHINATHWWKPFANTSSHRATVTEINRSLSATLKATGPSIIADLPRLKAMTDILVALITKEHSCQKDFGDEEDLGALEGTSEYDWLAIDTAMDVVIGLANALGESFGELWTRFSKPIIKNASSTDHVERSTSVGVIAECIKHMGPSVTPSTSSLMKLLLHRMSDEDSETKSNAAYAVGLLQQQSQDSEEIVKNFPTILNKLEPLLNTDEARCKDNAAGCVSRMILKHPSNIPIPQVLPALIEILPLKEDYEENEPIYEMIVQLCKITPFNVSCF